MKAATLLKVLGLCAVSSLSLAGGAAQAGDSCILSALSASTARPAVAADAGGCREASQARAHLREQDLADTIAPLVGSMAQTGVRTASTMMRAMSREAVRLLDE